MKVASQDQNLKNVSAYSVYNGLAAGFRSYVGTSQESTTSKRRKAKKRNRNQNGDVKKDESTMKEEEEEEEAKSSKRKRKSKANGKSEMIVLEKAPSEVNIIENSNPAKLSVSVTKLTSKSKTQTASSSNGSEQTSSPLGAAKDTENETKKKRKKRKNKKASKDVSDNSVGQTQLAKSSSLIVRKDAPPTKLKTLTTSFVGAMEKGNLVPNPLNLSKTKRNSKEITNTVSTPGKLKNQSSSSDKSDCAAIREGMKGNSKIMPGHEKGRTKITQGTEKGSNKIMPGTEKGSNKIMPGTEKKSKIMDKNGHVEKSTAPNISIPTAKKLMKTGKNKKSSDRGQSSTSKSVAVHCKDSSYQVISRVPPPDIRAIFTSNRVDNSVEHGRQTLDWLIHPVSSSEFMKNYWEKKPLLIKRKHNDADEYYKWILTTQSFDDVLRRNVVKYTVNLDITTYTNGIRETPSENLQGRARPAVVWDYYNNGCSLRMLNPQSFVKPLWRVNSYLQEWFGSFVGANLYLTPPDSQGFAPHYDDIEAFILQVEGKKQWKLYAPRSEGEKLPRFSSRNFSEETDNLGEPILDVVLEQGDLLYFPRGVIHQAKTVEGEHSMHLTLSCHQLNTYGDLLKHHVNHALNKLMAEDISFRQGLPTDYLSFMGIAHDNTQDRSLITKRKEFANKMKELVTKLANEPADHAADAMGKKFIWDSLPPYLTSRERETCVVEDGEFMQDGTVLNRVEFGPETEVKFIRKNCVRLMAEEGLLKLYYSSENSLVYHEEDAQFLELSVELAPAVNSLINEYPKFIKIEDLPHISKSIGEAEKIQMISDLWERGIIMTKDPLEACKFEDDGSTLSSDNANAGDEDDEDEEDVESVVLSELDSEDDDDFYDTSMFDDDDDDEGSENDSEDLAFDYEDDEGQSDNSSMDSDKYLFNALCNANHDQDDRDEYAMSDEEEVSDEEDAEMDSADDDDD